MKLFTGFLSQQFYTEGVQPSTMSTESGVEDGIVLDGWVRGLRNAIVYLFGIVVAGAGALGMMGEISLPVILSVPIFFIGLALVIAVHEYLNGPL